MKKEYNMKDDLINQVLQRGYLSNEIFKKFFIWYRDAARGLLELRGWPTVTTTLNVFYNILGHIKDHSGHQILYVDCDDINNFITNEQGVLDIKKRKYVADVWVIQQLVQHSLCHHHQSKFSPITFPTLILLLAFAVTRAGSLMATEIYPQVCVQYKVEQNSTFTLKLD
jgi:hypothetical protein